MKYARLTKEQLEELQPEFINFLAAQTITADEWDRIKKEKPEVAEDELDVFSDLIWEGVLNNVKYLEHISANQIMLFHMGESHMSLIGLKVDNEGVDLTMPYGYKWLRENLQDDAVSIYTSTKPVGEDRNKDIFVLIQQGAVITKGELYRYFEDII